MQGPLKTRAHTYMGPSYRKWPYIQGAPTDKGALQTKSPYRQGALTDKELMQTRGLIWQTKDQYRRYVIPTNKGPLQTIWGPYRQGTPTDI